MDKIIKLKEIHLNVMQVIHINIILKLINIQVKMYLI